MHKFVLTTAHYPDKQNPPTVSVIIIERKAMDKMIKIVDENKNEIKSDQKVCHRFQPVVVPYQAQTVTGVETRIDMKQINCYKEKCELWYVEEGMCAEKYNYIKNKEGDIEI